jgi:hypothetical protein
VASPASIKAQINEIVAYLVTIGLASDQNFVFLRPLDADLVEVSFHQAQHLTIAMKNLSYVTIYDYMARERAFVVKMPDGALLQLRYLFERHVLAQHILGFFPSPHLEEFQNNPDIYMEEHIYADVIARNIVPFPIRFDYSANTELHRPVIHPKSHMTLGQYENCRIPVSAPITPYWFIAFVLRNFYHTAFYEFADKLPVFAETFADSIHPEERKVIHVQVPPSGG